MTANLPLLVRYPNQIGNCGRYTLNDQREYFSRFEGGAIRFFGVALQHALTGDLLSFQEECAEIFETYYQPQFADNTASIAMYHDEQREFFRRTFDLYRYAKTSIGHLGDELPFIHVRPLDFNHRFDTGAFLLR
jgi:hypothetical protein